MAAHAPTAPLPRQLAPGLFWLGDCQQAPYKGTFLHGYNSCYLLSGTDASIIVEGGLAKDLDEIERQLDVLVARGVPEVRHVFVTHAEPPHSSGIGRFLDRFPAARLSGDLRDLHLVFPQFADRFSTLGVGDEIDLGGTSLRMVDAVLRDLPATLWGFDTARRVLFPGDGFAYMHHHEAGQCGRVAEEVPELPLGEMSALFADIALYWTRFSDIEPYIRRLEKMISEDLDVALIAPTHGLPIIDVPGTAPLVYEGLRMGSKSRQQPFV